jgi:hypothetical protein
MMEGAVKVPSGDGDSIVGMRRALSIGSTAVVAAAVGAACSFAFSGAIALNDQAAVQVSASPVIVPAAESPVVVVAAPEPVDETGPVVVPAPEPRDLTRSVRSSASPSDPGRAGAADAADSPGNGTDTGTDQNGIDGSLDLGATGGAVAPAPGQTGGAFLGSGQSAAHSNRDAALAAAPGRNDATRAGRDQSDRHRDRDAACGHASSSSHPGEPDSGGG